MCPKGTVIGVTLSLGLMAVGCSTPAKVSVGPGGGLADEGGRAWLGYLKHREWVYRLEDLLDPRYRAASDDPFVRQFEARHMYADWAGL